MALQVGIRTISRTAAALLALAAALSLRLPLGATQAEPPTIVGAFIAEIATEPRARPRVVEQSFSEADAPSEAAASAPLSQMPRLWTYTAAGDIAFDTTEQLQRCTRARQNRQSEADCPNAFETRRMLLSEEGQRARP